LSEAEIKTDKNDPTANLAVKVDGKSAITWGKIKTNF